MIGRQMPRGAGRVSGGFDELLERLLREHKEKHQDTDMMDVLLSAYKYENADYKITRNHIKLLIVVIVFFFREKYKTYRHSNFVFIRNSFITTFFLG